MTIYEIDGQVALAPIGGHTNLWQFDPAGYADGSPAWVDLRAVGTGDCFNDSKIGVGTELVGSPVPCEEPHLFQYYAAPLVAGPFYDDATRDAAISDACLRDFRTFYGVAFDASSFTYTNVRASDSWRNIAASCYSYLPDHSPWATSSS